MRETLGPELRRLLQDVARTQPDCQLGFIVTGEPDCRLAERVPFVIDNVFDSIHAVAGRMSAGQALQLAQQPGIVSIEYDGQMQALAAQLSAPP